MFPREVARRSQAVGEGWEHPANRNCRLKSGAKWGALWELGTLGGGEPCSACGVQGTSMPVQVAQAAPHSHPHRRAEPCSLVCTALKVTVRMERKEAKEEPGARPAHSRCPGDSVGQASYRARWVAGCWCPKAGAGWQGAFC